MISLIDPNNRISIPTEIVNDVGIKDGTYLGFRIVGPQLILTLNADPRTGLCEIVTNNSFQLPVIFRECKHYKHVNAVSIEVDETKNKLYIIPEEKEK